MSIHCFRQRLSLPPSATAQPQRYWGSIWTLCFASMVSIGGCAMPGKTPSEPPQASANPVQQPAAGVSQPPSEPSPDQKTLAAIEDFLTRTQQYRQPPLVIGDPAKQSLAAVKPQRQPEAMPASPVAAPAAAEGTALAPRPTSTNTEMIAGAPAAPQTVLPVPAVERVTIQWDESAGREEEDVPARPNAANTPMTATGGTREPAARRMIDELEDEAAARKDFESAWRLKLGQLAVGREHDAAQAAPELLAESATLLAALVDAAVAVRAAASNPLDDGNTALEKVEALRSQAAALADPVVSGVALCRKVITFGVYEEMPPEEFVSGRTIQLIVYSEVENFRSRGTDEGAFETQLASRLEVFTKNGESVWQRDEPEVIDTCRKLRRDFFIAQRVTLPPTLPAGDYVLKVRVEDKLAARAAEAAKPFTIHSPISVAKKP